MRYVAVVLLWAAAVHAQGSGYLVIDRAAHWRITLLYRVRMVLRAEKGGPRLC